MHEIPPKNPVNLQPNHNLVLAFKASESLVDPCNKQYVLNSSNNINLGNKSTNDVCLEGRINKHSKNGSMHLNPKKYYSKSNTFTHSPHKRFSQFSVPPSVNPYNTDNSTDHNYKNRYKHNQSVELRTLKHNISKYLNQEHQQQIRNHDNNDHGNYCYNAANTGYCDDAPKNRHRRNIRDYFNKACNGCLKGEEHTHQHKHQPSQLQHINKKHSFHYNSPQKMCLDYQEHNRRGKPPQHYQQAEEEPLFTRKTFSIKEMKLRRKGCNPYSMHMSFSNKTSNEKLIKNSYYKILYIKAKSPQQPTIVNPNLHTNFDCTLVEDGTKTQLVNNSNKNIQKAYKDSGSTFYINYPLISIASHYELKQNETASNFFTKKKFKEPLFQDNVRDKSENRKNRRKQANKVFEQAHDQRHGNRKLRKASHNLAPWQREEHQFQRQNTNEDLRGFGELGEDRKSDQEDEGVNQNLNRKQHNHNPNEEITSVIHNQQFHNNI